MKRPFTGNRLFFRILLIILPFCISCDIINPEEDIPSYIRIESVDFSITGTPGGNTHNITDVWADLDGKVLGVFELPAIFPVLAEGPHTILLKPGIKTNGISDVRTVYPFYTNFELDTLFEPGNIIEICPDYKYKPEADRDDWQEDFEISGIITLEASSVSDVELVVIDDPEKDGNHIGAIYLDDSNPSFDGFTKDGIDVPSGISEIYLEFDYQCNNEISVGLLINTPGQVVAKWALGINRHPVRNRIYIDLSDHIWTQNL
ncbi:MAG: hypothetical protein KJ607_07555, partial [Bacteroidetes bacterium]|nr:hypothetical protein [Bacteroidota bacterium]